MYGFYLKKASFFFGVLVCLFVQNLSAQSNQEIYYKYCVAHPHLECFNPVSGAVDSVGRDVFELGGGYKFCMKIDTVDAGFAPIRVMLVLDKSYSMCGNSGGCCTAGDSSGNCMMNDPTNMRVAAAIAFVDSLAAKSPNSEVGVITYDRSVFPNNPIPINTPDNIAAIHGWIQGSGCTNPAPPGGLGKTTAIKATYLGLGLQSGLTVVDYNFASMPANMKRHIILLTDGAWDDVDTRAPQTLIDAYKAQYSDRAVPTIHGVFLSNVDLHRAHGYPDEGCSTTDPVILTHLQKATTLGGSPGLYFPGATPQTVVTNFSTLLYKMTERVAQQLTGMIVTNTTNGEIRTQQTISAADSSIAGTVGYQATLNNLPLVMGLNTLTVKRIVKKSGSAILDTITSTVSIYRAENWTTQVNPKEYELYCVNDSTTISIRVTPSTTPVNSPFTVNATITMKDKLILDPVQVRLFTKFPDSDANTKAVFHLENNLDNAAAPPEKATSVLPLNYNKTDTLFGQYVISQGSFKTGSISSITGDFALEAWIRPPTAGGQTAVFSGDGFTFGIGADRVLYFTPDGAQPVKSSVAVDANAWSHIAISRASGTVRIYINAVDVSNPVQFTSALQGMVTITCPAGGLLDEVRISDHNRMRTDSNLPRLDIPSLPNPTWTINGQSITQPMTVISPDRWKNGNIQFQFSSPIPAQLVVNFQHLGPVESRWSKNGNSVFATGDLQPIVSITVTPNMLPVNNPFNVNATIALQPWIILDTIQVRVFTQFPDNDARTKALFHLERNVNVINAMDSTEVTTILSPVIYNETDTLFGKSVISAGSFKTGIGTLNGDFAFEAWIRPSNSVGQTAIFSNTEFSFGINADRTLYFTAGAETVKSIIAVDANAWSHVAISRASGTVRIFLNGVDVADPVQFAGTLQGVVTITCPAGGLLDEVRISDQSRLRADPNYFRLDIPSLQNPTWTINGKPATQAMLLVTPSMWTGQDLQLNLQFQFSSPVNGKLVVNFQHKGSILSQWSKNGNPVFAAGDLQGPFVTWATFTTGQIASSYDTLGVRFSEKVRCDSLKNDTLPINSFQVFGPGHVLKPSIFEGAYYLDGKNCPGIWIDSVTIVVKTRVDGIVPLDDSILLVAYATVDTAGNYPDTTRLGTINYGPGRGIQIVPLQSSGNVSPMILAQGLKDRTGITEEMGKVIVIQTRDELLPIPGQEGKPKDSLNYGKTILYDAVANVVRSNLEIRKFKTSNRMYYVLWDGTNRNKRRVASGAYVLKALVNYKNEVEAGVQPPPLMTKFSIKWSAGGR